MRAKLIIMAWVMFIYGTYSKADYLTDRIWIEVQINGKPARLNFDSGAAGPFLNGAAVVKRFGLKSTVSPTNSSEKMNPLCGGTTEECAVKVGMHVSRGSFIIMNVPKDMYVDADGVLGWSTIPKDCIIQIDAPTHQLIFLSTLPNGIEKWIKLPLVIDSTTLQFELSPNSKPGKIVLVDTGDPSGVGLHPAEWLEWKTSHPNQPLTLIAGVMPSSGKIVKEESWAENLILGPLTLDRVPVTEANPSEMKDIPSQSKFSGVLGLAALRRLDFIVDVQHGIVYLRPKTTEPLAYQHNRLGAVFSHSDPQSEVLTARVSKNSPAFKAGVCDGDVLLLVTPLNAELLKDSEAGYPLNEIYQRPDGAKLILKLKRGNEVLEKTVILQNLIPPHRSGN